VIRVANSGEAHLRLIECGGLLYTPICLQPIAL